MQTDTQVRIDRQRKNSERKFRTNEYEEDGKDRSSRV